ncbi:MAG: hypothetical protein AAFY22_06825 [Pseudomonadota bacterium]
MSKDLRKEQVALLRFEKQIAGLAAALAAGSATAQAAQEKIGGDAAMQAYADLQASLIDLAETAGKAHEILNAHAEAVGATVLQANGVPKRPPVEVVQSILGLG